MRLSHVEGRIDQQISHSQFITQAVDNLMKVGSSNITSHRIEARLNAVKEIWEKFSVNHDAIKIAIQQLETQDKNRILEHDYFLKEIFNSTRESYLETLEFMNSRLERLHQSHQRSPSAQSSNPPAVYPLGPRLPRIDLPKFDGTPSEWLPFKDLFDSLVLANPSLSSVEKLQYLKTSLVGSASHLLKNTALIADNFQKAWDALVTFYENKRLLVNSALHSLLTIRRMTRESATEMEQLYTTIMQIYRSLETLGRPIQYWDDFLVFIAVQRLDSDSVKAWEHHLGSSKEPPTWQQFSEFLMSRMLSLQAFEKSRSGRPANYAHSNSTKVHYVNNATSGPSKCLLCSSDHPISKCPSYFNKTESQRLEFVIKHKLCYNCLSQHRVSACQSTKRCLKCGKKHHSSIHNASASSKPNSSTGKPEAQVHHSTISQSLRSSHILLATARVLVMSQKGEKTLARALIDPGSQISFITERLAQRLHLTRQHSSINLHGVGASKAGHTRGKVSITLRPHFPSTVKCVIIAHILPKLTSTLPSINIQSTNWSHIKGLTLADPSYTSPGQIDIIIGCDYYGQIIEEGLKRGSPLAPIAQQTIFGWVISGPSESSSQAQAFHITANQELHDLLKEFWRLEEVPSSSNAKLSEENQICEDHFQHTHSRDNSGRYIVRLPLKQSIDTLGDSKAKARRSLFRLTKKFKTDSLFEKAYTEFLKEYETLKHMQIVPNTEEEPEHTYYLPHHGVFRATSLTTKLRVVFNGSSRTSTGASLNDILHTGPKLQTDLVDVLLWFRQFLYVFTADIEKMYRQIKVHPDDWKLQRILWLSKSSKIQTYQLTTVTYGLACAPYLALKCLQQLIKDEGHKWPLATETLLKGRYVDDVFGGSDSISQSQDLVQHVTQLCMAGGFPLQKWASNHPAILQSIPKDKQVTPSSIEIKTEEMVHTLGLYWNPTTDTFHFTLTPPETKISTKRTILSTIAKLFDPLGFLSPAIIPAKVLIQELWSLNLDWDDCLPSNILRKWTNFLNQLPELSSIAIPRWLGMKQSGEMEIHGFCDASQQAIAAVVYIRTMTNHGEVKTAFACSKTKVAPLKRLTIPRLELSGAVLLTKLISHIVQVLSIDHTSIYLWTDSAIVLTWINAHPSRWKDFIHNRVCFIQETIPKAQWRFISGKENPADCATRGMTPAQLSHHTLWWSGPDWLKQPSHTWPNSAVPLITDNLEERALHVHSTTTEPGLNTTKDNQETEIYWDLLYRYSDLTRLIRITALCQKFCLRLRRKIKASETHLTCYDLEQARLFWIKTIQATHFKKELKTLAKGEQLPKSHPLIRLTPFIDAQGFVRLGGRLQASLLPFNTKHPLILPKDSPLTKLVIWDAQFRTLHGGIQATTVFIRNNYWILGGRAPVRALISSCIKCARYRQKRAAQLMGQLPATRITPSRPFLHTGLDYAGPLIIKTWRGRAARTYKAYIALFICQSTSVVHLELVTDYTTDAFIAAYKRFTARRGICATLRSDCGTNLKGADAELQRSFSSASKELHRLASLLANDGTQWMFNPPAAPHFGGLWEAAVKSVKHHLKRVIGDHQLTYEEMTTVLTQIKAVLNSRPLCPLTDDAEDLTALTPGHFLIGSSLAVIPEPSLEDVQTSRLSRWQLLRQALDHFWARWSRECLQRYQSIYKWNQSSSSLKPGTMVLVCDERYPPSKWPLGRIIETHPGKDTLTRVATIRTQTSTLIRPVTKICPLPISSDTTS